MPPLKLVVFDCDGVMFDSLDANRAYYNDILAHFGHPPMDDEELAYVHVQHVADSIRFIFRHYPDDYAAAEVYRRGLDYTPYLSFMRMEPDLPEFLRLLRPHYHTAISTNRSNTMASILDIFGLSQYFDMVVTAFDVAHPKPHPEALQRILSHFALTAAEGIYIGDSEVDRQHCQAVGMRLIAFKNPELVADFQVTSFMEIASLPPLVCCPQSLYP